MRLTRALRIRALLLSVITSSIFASGVQSSATSSGAESQQSRVVGAETEPGQDGDCDINGPVKDLEECPPETIIAQYKEQGVDVVLRGGAYWEVITGEYVNERYRYKVVLPQGVEALCAPAPAPFHGFFIDLAHELTPPGEPSPRRGTLSYYNWDIGLSVTGYYNAADLASVDELVSSYLKPDDEHESDVVLVAKENIRLRGIRAIHYVVRFSHPKSGEAMISDNIAAIRRGYFVYEISLTTLASCYLEEAPVLEQVIKGWRLLPFYE